MATTTKPLLTQVTRGSKMNTQQNIQPISSFRAFKILTSIQLQATNGSFGDKPKKGTNTLSKLGTTLMSIGVVLASLVLSIAVMALGAGSAIPGIAVLVVTIVAIALTFKGATGALFGFRDFDETMALPVNTRIVVLARISAFYIKQLRISACILIPAIAVFFAYDPSTISALGIISAVLIVVLAASVPVTVAILFAFLLAFFTARFKFLKWAYTAIGLILSVAVMVLPTVLSLNGLDINPATSAGSNKTFLYISIASQICSLYPMSFLANQAVLGNALSLGIFTLTSVLFIFICLEVFGRNFMRINAAFQSHAAGAKVDISSEATKTKPPIFAMTLKELRQIFTVPSFAINCCSGPGIVLVLGIVFVALGSQGATDAIVKGYMHLDDEASLAAISGLGFILPWLFAMFASAAPTTPASLSLEGKSNWLMATLPMPPNVIIGAKILANFVLALPAILIASILLFASGALDLFQMFECIFLPCAFLVLNATIGAYLDAKKPNYSWVAPKQVTSKSNAVNFTTFFALISTFVMLAAGAVICFVFGVVLAHVFMWLVILLLFALSALVFFRATKNPLFVY